MKIKLIDDWRQKILKFWTVRIQLVAAAFTSLMFIDPQVLLYGWNMMPTPVRDLLPDSLFRTIGIVLFVTNMLTIVLRPVAQTKLKEVGDGQP